MEEKQISERDSLQLIQQMINTAKQEQKDDGKGWITWGWVLFLTCILSFLNLNYRWVNAYFFWNAFGLFTLLMLIIKSVRFYIGKRTTRVKTYTSDLLGKLNIGFFLSLMLIIFSMNIGVEPIYGFALLLGLYAFWILIYGAVLNFRPSIIGAIVTWGFAFASLFVHKFEYTMLLHAAAVLCGYIIPGHIANREFKKIQSKEKL